MTPQGMETDPAKTEGLGAKHDSPCPVGDAPEHPPIDDYRNRLERAEAECKELRERLAKPVQHIDAGKLHEMLKLFEMRANNQSDNLVAPIMAGMLKIIAEAVKQSTTNGS